MPIEIKIITSSVSFNTNTLNKGDDITIAFTGIWRTGRDTK
jgi:hypothetical protein